MKLLHSLPTLQKEIQGKEKTEESDFVPAATNYSTKHAINLNVLTQTKAERGSYKVIKTTWKAAI